MVCVCVCVCVHACMDMRAYCVRMCVHENESEYVFWRSKKVVNLEPAICCCYWPPRSKWLVDLR